MKTQKKMYQRWSKWVLGHAGPRGMVKQSRLPPMLLVFFTGGGERGQYIVFWFVGPSGGVCWWGLAGGVLKHKGQRWVY